jgi:hypothetical protein
VGTLVERRHNLLMESATISPAERARLDAFVSDLRRIFATRLESVVAYALDRRDPSDALHTLVLAETVVFEDLAACRSRMPEWERSGLATPLILTRHEFLRSLDVFPIEYGAIIRSHLVITGTDPFAGCTVREADLRRAVELQAKSHLIHLREGFLEAGTGEDAIGQLIAGSLPAYRTLLAHLERLNPEVAGRQESTMRLLQELSVEDTIADQTTLLQRYIADVERIWRLVDTWR